MTQRVALLCLIFLAACAERAPDLDAASVDVSVSTLDSSADDTSDASPPIAPCLENDALPGCPATITSPIILGLAHAPFPNEGPPDVALHVPPGFLPNDEPGLIVFFHGFNNCVQVVVSATNAPCSAGSAPRTALSLAA
jgi:hypothetical protein